MRQTLWVCNGCPVTVNTATESRTGWRCFVILSGTTPLRAFHLCPACSEGCGNLMDLIETDAAQTAGLSMQVPLPFPPFPGTYGDLPE